MDARISVIVPTYRRPEHLRRCLEGLAAQTRRPDEILVVRRVDDAATERVLAEHASDGVLDVSVEGDGVLRAMAAGVRQSTGSVLAFTDDDAVPRPDWLERICTVFQDLSIGAVGGRDVLHPSVEPDASAREDVGRITDWGRVIGNHHRGTGPARDVMVLKAVNMAFRSEGVRLPTCLRGAGAQAHFEVAMCLWTRRQGWRIVYDPAIVVDHYPGPRFDGDRRRSPDRDAVRGAAYNLVFCLLGLEPTMWWRRAAYGLAVGDRGAPGVARAVVAAITGEWMILRNLWPSVEGQVQALADIARGLRPVENRAESHDGG